MLFEILNQLGPFHPYLFYVPILERYPIRSLWSVWSSLRRLGGLKAGKLLFHQRFSLSKRFLDFNGPGRKAFSQFIAVKEPLESSFYGPSLIVG
jgi:hypothetical protein